MASRASILVTKLVSVPIKNYFLLELLLLQPTISNRLIDVRLYLPLADASRWCPLARGRSSSSNPTPSYPGSDRFFAMDTCRRPSIQSWDITGFDDACRA
jgi:hypothetical protein